MSPEPGAKRSRSNVFAMRYAECILRAQTAESLVRELARALQDADALIGHELPTLLLMQDGGPITQCKLLITAALSRVPKELLPK